MSKMSSFPEFIVRSREVSALKKEKQRRFAEKETSKFRTLNAKNHIYVCKKCNLSHSYGKCPAYGTTSINNRSESQSETTDSTWFQELFVNGNLMNFKLDSGAQVNVLTFEILQNWENIHRIKTNARPILDYSNNQVPIIGELILTVKNKSSSSKLKFRLTRLKSSPILELNSCLKLKLIKRIYQLECKCQENQNNCVLNESIPVQIDNHVKFCKVDSSIVAEIPDSVINEFHDVFSGIGKLNKVVKIHLKDNYTPSVAASRKIPLALQDKVKAELKRMENMGVITKVEQPTEWVRNIVVIDNPNKLEICIDPRPLNKGIKIPHYPISSADILMINLQGSTVFSLFDTTNGFWQLALEEESSYLTNFANP
ncbi:hypothetical protein AVEN_58449-1 [Araneus ventricosus]|uniref:Peptidase A2 domain-containing protein n=1 Tax=Araneus ventricosus TaxID=182803 RepID=A0A4Y2AYL3_ARAVE|nr:hypothetical protein AVEN_58449-1 [Araneus ventricosus]